VIAVAGNSKNSNLTEFFKLISSNKKAAVVIFRRTQSHSVYATRDKVKLNKFCPGTCTIKTRIVGRN